MSDTARRQRHVPGRTSILKSLAILAPLFLILPYWSSKMHYSLPEPVKEMYNPVTGLPQLSETAILSHAQHLSEEIGYRTVGTREHALGDQWMLDQVEQLREQCQQVVAQDRRRNLECEVWRQEGSGTHRFDMMGKRVMKHYEKLSNIVMRISDGTATGKANALLLNSHLDSTVSSPGAADDAISVGIMLDIARVLIQTPGWEPANALILLFNNAEESLQDGSHLFATQSRLNPTIRAVINLEAAGNTGPEVLFQATSEEMIEAYSHVPRPHGTVLASDVFKTGIILSDTDFRQFEEYQNLTGLDMAIVGDSYLYHTRKDLVRHTEPGVAQHYADNVFALVTYLTSPHTKTLQNLSHSATPPTSTYFSVLGRWFFLYSAHTALTIQLTVLAGSVLVIGATDGLRFDRVTLRAVSGFFGSLIGAVVAANVAALIMNVVFQRGMSWFSNELSCLLLYGPPALAGAFFAQYYVSSRSSTINRRLEASTFNIIHLFYTFGAILLQSAGLGSAYIFSVFSLGSLFALVINALSNSLDGPHRGDGAESFDLGVVTYFIASIIPLTLGTELAVSFLTTFVPLTGRLGAEAPVEHIIATITTVFGFFVVSFTLPFAHRLGRRLLLLVIFGLLASTALMMIVFSLARTPFDPMHQKRFFVLHVENMTTNEHHLHMSGADAAPGFDVLVHDLASSFGVPLGKPVPVIMNEYNADWDVLYPFSQFLTPYKLQLPVPHDYASDWSSKFYLTTVNDVVDLHTYTRTLTLVVNHPGIIWTTIAFDAHVLSWSLDDNPPPYKTRHHIKEASFYGVESYTIELTVIVPFENPEEELLFNYVGITEKACWPAKQHSSARGARTPQGGGGGEVLDLFESLDQYLYVKTGDTVDATMLGCVAGVVSL